MKNKKYQLVNSYFKVAGMYGLPQVILEISEYLKLNGELPFKYSGDNWVYDAFCEFQKKNGVQNSQYLTPDATVERMMYLACKYFKEMDVLEPCCGTGQITKELLKYEYNVEAFDNDPVMTKICEIVTKLPIVYLRDFKYFTGKHNQIIANPPYEIHILIEFLEWIYESQDCGGISILLLPRKFIDKGKPSRLFQVLFKFGVLERENMQEEFARTKIPAEIVVLRRL